MKMSFHSFARISMLMALLALGGAIVCPSVSASWRVIPIRLEFNQQTRSGVITLVNDGEAPITFAIEAAEWTQDTGGEDSYLPTEDLVFFPRQLTIQSDSERIIRAGVRMPAINEEKTYRLFIKEAADPSVSQGTQVAIAIRFGVPVFVRPPQETLRGEIEILDIKEGEAHAKIINTGNVHSRIQTVQYHGSDHAGNQILKEEVSGWYLLDGASRIYKTPLDQNICTQLAKLSVQMIADHLTLSRTIDVDPQMCAE